MARQLAPCGTAAAYRRHKRRGEPVDDACAVAARQQKNERVLASREQLAEVTRLNVAKRLGSGESPGDPIDPMAKARYLLQLVEARLEAGAVDRATVQAHTDLVDRIVQLERASKQTEKVSALDQLAQRRADRLAASAD